jgi:hypothetical protein
VLDLDDVIENFDRMTQHMENTVVSMVTDNSKEIEEILKQLLIYLDSTSKNLDGINTAVGDFIDDYEKSAGKGSLGGEDFYKIKETVEGFYEKIKQAQDKNALKILEYVKKVGESNQTYLRRVLSGNSAIIKSVGESHQTSIENSKSLQELKNVLTNIAGEVGETKQNVSRNQENLMTVITAMMDSETKKAVASEMVRTEEIKSNSEKTKMKFSLAAKIISVLLGSGGVLYFILDLILGSGG